MNGSQASLQLAVRDIQTTEAFYCGILGLQVARAITAWTPEHIVLKLEGMELLFMEEETLLQAHPFMEERHSSFPKGIGLTIHVRVSNIEEIYEEVLEEEMEVVYPLEIKPYGVMDFWCFDPDGYLVVVEESIR